MLHPPDERRVRLKGKTATLPSRTGLLETAADVTKWAKGLQLHYQIQGWTSEVKDGVRKCRTCNLQEAATAGKFRNIACAGFPLSADAEIRKFQQRWITQLRGRAPPLWIAEKLLSGRFSLRC